MTLHDFLRLREVTFTLVALFNHPHPKGALFGIGLGHRLDQRQGQLTLAEIVAHVLADGGRGAGVIQKIIGNLKGDAQRVAIGVKRLHHIFGRACDNAAHLGRRREQGSGLAAHHFQINVLARRQILRGGQLQNLALSNGGRSIGKDRQDADLPRFGHQLKAAGEKVIADQNR